MPFTRNKIYIWCAMLSTIPVQLQSFMFPRGKWNLPSTKKGHLKLERLTVSVLIVNGHIHQWLHEKCSSLFIVQKLSRTNTFRVGRNLMHSFLPPPLKIFFVYTSKEIKRTFGNCRCTDVQFGIFFYLLMVCKQTPTLSQKSLVQSFICVFHSTVLD